MKMVIPSVPKNDSKLNSVYACALALEVEVVLFNVMSVYECPN